MSCLLRAAVCAITILALAAAPAVQGAEPVRLRMQVVMDQQGMGEEALRLLVPQDWRFDGGVSWNTAKFPAEAMTSFTVASPDGASVFQQFPHATMFWSDDQMLQYSYRQNGIPIMPPASAEQLLRELYLRNYRPEAAAAEILELQPLPELAQQALQWQQVLLNVFNSISPFTFRYELRADAARARFRYTAAGTQIIEDATVVIHYFIAYMPGAYGPIPAITWISGPTSFRAPAADMDGRLETFRTIAASRRDNPVWHEHITRLAATITREQLRQQSAISERLAQIRRTQSETSDLLFESWQKRSEAYDRIFDNYSQSLRGVQTYADPVSSRDVELPHGYNHAWSNGTDYLLSDEPGFNPNQGSTGLWTEIHPQQ